MNDRSGRKRRLRIASLIAVALVAALFIISAEPRDASGFKLLNILSTVKDLADAKGRQKGLTNVMNKLFGHAGGFVDLIANAGTNEQAEAVFQKTMNDFGDIPLGAMDPTYGVAGYVKNKLKSAKQKIKNFVGGAREAVSGTKVDERAALAVGDYESKTGIFDNKPLPTPVRTKPSSAGQASRDRDISSSSSSAWFEEMIVRPQVDYPHCWGVVEADHDPYKCMAEADAKREAAARASAKTEPETPDTGKVDWASGNWKAEGTGWSGWDRSDSRYDDADRDSARVGIYALECWGVPGVTAESGLYDLMKGRMARNECPEEDRSQEQADKDKSDYEAALADTLGEEPGTTAEDDSYQAALSALEAKDEVSGGDAAALDAGLDPPDDDYHAALRDLEVRQEETKQAEADEARKEEWRDDKAEKTEVAAVTTLAAGDVFWDCPECPEMVVIPGGTISLNAVPGRRIRISQFAAGKYEVTRSEFASFVQETGYVAPWECGYMPINWHVSPPQHHGLDWRDPGFPQSDDHPVVCVDWEGANLYSAWLSQKVGENYRLLSYAEWEYAARGGMTTIFHFGSTISPNVANYHDDHTLVRKYRYRGRNLQYLRESYFVTTPAGKYLSNQFGLHDMYGNVWEWVEDCKNPEDSPISRNAPSNVPSDGTSDTWNRCEQKFTRGGSYSSSEKEFILADAGVAWARPVHSVLNDVGFRVVRMLAP